MVGHKETCLKTNGKQTVNLKGGSTMFKNHLKQLAVLFKIYTDFESLLNGITSSDKNDNASYTEKYLPWYLFGNIFLAALPTKLFELMINLVNQLFFTGKKNAINRFLEPILKEMNYCKNMIKKQFKKNLGMSEEDEERFQLSSICWICDKLFDEITK